MADSFGIEVEFKGKVYDFEAQLVSTGYTYKFCVIINGIEVVYEPDEERSYRAMVNGTDQAKISDLDRELIKLTGSILESIRNA